MIAFSEMGNQNRGSKEYPSIRIDVSIVDGDERQLGYVTV
jgi:hypothetical protein